MKRKRRVKIYRTNIDGTNKLVRAYSLAQAAAKFEVAPSTFSRWSSVTNLPPDAKVDIDCLKSQSSSVAP